MPRIVGNWKLTGVDLPIKQIILSRMLMGLELFILFIAACAHSKGGTIFMSLVVIIHIIYETYKFLSYLQRTPEHRNSNMSEVLTSSWMGEDLFHQPPDRDEHGVPLPHVRHEQQNMVGVGLPHPTEFDHVFPPSFSSDLDMSTTSLQSAHSTIGNSSVDIREYQRRQQEEHQRRIEDEKRAVQERAESEAAELFGTSNYVPPHIPSIDSNEDVLNEPPKSFYEI